MTRRFVGFDDTYRVPVPVNVSRGVLCGPYFHLCGQLHMSGTGESLDPGDLSVQTEGAMRRIYDVCGHAGEGAEPAIVLTPIDSFPVVGCEVEIDAIFATDADRAKGTGSGGASARRHGDIVFAEASYSGPPKPPADQADAVLQDLLAALDGTGAGSGDVCRLALYLRADLTADDHAALLDRLALGFAEPGPVFETMPLSRLGRAGEVLRLEAVAVRGTDSGRRPSRRLDQASHWRWPSGGPWSQAIRSGEMVFVGAQLPVDRSGKLVGEGDLAAQTHAAMRHMQSALSAMDSGFPEVVKVNARFTGDWDPAAWGLNVGIRSDYYGKPGPASTGIIAPCLEIDGAMIQAGCIAIAD
jgi:2-iminobutanoate/2-iminopropanoate deaminase